MAMSASGVRFLVLWSTIARELATDMYLWKALNDVHVLVACGSSSERAVALVTAAFAQGEAERRVPPCAATLARIMARARSCTSLPALLAASP